MPCPDGPRSARPDLRTPVSASLPDDPFNQPYVFGDSASDCDRLAITTVLDGADPFANRGWRFIGSDGFSGRRGELHFSGGLLQGDVSGDGSAELRVQRLGVDRFSPDWMA